MSVPPRMKNPNVSMKSIHDYKWGKQDIPTRENCDLDDPKEMFLWCFTAPPGLNGAPLVFPAEVFMMWSEHLYECGARLSGAPVKKYQRPSGTEPNRFTTPGKWVPLTEADPPPHPAKVFWESLSLQQQAELIEAIQNDERLIPEQKRVLIDRLKDGDG